MENFNPIKELKPEDPFNAPEGESSDEIESIRLTLISTRNKTRELVNVIKKKNLDFVKDTTTIKDLDRRLRITIARIPIMRGDASTRSGQDKDPNMIFRAFNRRSRTIKTTKPTTTRVRPTPKIGERIKNAIIDTILLALPIKIKIPTKIPGLGKLFKPLLKRLGIKIGTKKLGKKALEETLESTASKKSTGFNIFDFFRKRFSKKLKPKTLVKKSTYELRRENMRRVRLEGEKRAGLFDKKKKVKYENFLDRGRVKNAASDYTGPGNLLQKLKQRSVRKIKNIYGDTNEGIKNLQEFIRAKKNNPNLKLEDFMKQKQKVEIPNPSTSNSGAKSGTKSKEFNTSDKNNEVNMRIKSILEGKGAKSKDLGGGGPLGFLIDGKSMNNDIAMLNRDTSATRTIVIATGEMA